MILAWFAVSAFAEEPEDVGEVDLAGLLAPSVAGSLDAHTQVASAAELAGRESPGVITVLTREELLASGARDLADVLRLLPGFEFGVDVEGVVSVGIRGLWAHEGKWLLLVDGHPMTENAYSATPLGNRYPIDVIERIEVIRGPGSTMYGGYAELGVIRITTIAASDRVGTFGGAHYERSADATMRWNLGGGGGTTLPGGGHFGAYAIGGQGIRSDRTFVDGYGGTADLRDARLTPVQLGANVRRGGLSADLLVDRYGTRMADAYGEVLPEAISMDFTTLAAGVRYEAPVAEDVAVTPYAHVTLQQPWYSPDAPQDSVYYYKRYVVRGTVGVDALAHPRDGLDVRAGAESYVDDAWGTTAYGASRETYANVAAFGEVVSHTRYATVAGGLRAEYHTVGGPLVAPRIAVTRVFGEGHVKLLAARAFRPPGVENARLGVGDVDSEIADVIEAEGGYALGDAQYVTVNAFDQILRKPILYFYEERDDGTTIDGYLNADRVGTRGIELQYRLRTGRVGVAANWSVYSAAGKAHVDAWSVPGREDLTLGFPARKGVITVTANPWRAVRLGATGVFASERAAYVPNGTGDGLELAMLDPYSLIDLSVGTDRLAQRPFGVTLVAHDVLNAAPAIPQPYDGGHAPLPGPSRSLELRLVWDGAHLE